MSGVYLRILCERCGKERMVNEVHMAQRTLIRDLLNRMRHRGCEAEVLQRPEVVSSALSVRAERRGKPMIELLITVSALFLALIGCAVLNPRSGDTEEAVAEEQARRMQAIALSVV